MKQSAQLLRALADEDRLRILDLLLQEPDGACVCELVDALRTPQYQVSRQLAVLRDASLVAGEKRGNWVYYRVSSALPPLAAAVLKALTANIEDETVREDRERLQRRINLREEGACTIGYEPKRRFRERIPMVWGKTRA